MPHPTFSTQLKANHLVTPPRISARLPFWSWSLYNYWWIRWNFNSGNTKLSTHLITQLLVTFRIFIIAGKGHVITICYDSVTRLIETNSFSSLLWALQLYCRKKKIASEICFWRFDWWRYVGNACFFWSSEFPLEWINMISDVLSR